MFSSIKPKLFPPGELDAPMVKLLDKPESKGTYSDRKIPNSSAL